MTVTCLAFSGVIAEDGVDTQELSVGPTAPIAGTLSGLPIPEPPPPDPIAEMQATIDALLDTIGGSDG